MHGGEQRKRRSQGRDRRPVEERLEEPGPGDVVVSQEEGAPAPAPVQVAAPAPARLHLVYRRRGQYRESDVGLGAQEGEDEERNNRIHSTESVPAMIDTVVLPMIPY